MNKLIIGKTLGIGLGLMVPFVAIASPDEAVTIRVMESADDSKKSVMQHIALPAKPGEKEAKQLKEQEKLKKRERNTVRVNEDNLENEEMAKEREREMEEQRNEAGESHQDHVEGIDKGLENQRPQAPGK